MKQDSGVNVAEDVADRDYATQVVDFDETDPENPVNWSRPHKWTITMSIAALAVIVQVSTITPAPISPQILHDFRSSNQLYGTLLVTIWGVGEIVGPFLYGPLSESYGRLPVLHVTNVLFTVLSIASAEATSIQMLVALRFLNGLCVAVNALCAGIVGDLFAKEDRAAPLTIMMFAGQVGQAIGPIASSYLAQAHGWRWAFRLPTILMAAVALIFAFVYKETYRVKILQRRAAKLRSEYGTDTIRSKYEAVGNRSLREIAKVSFRPAYLLCRSSVLAGITFYVGISCALYYVIVTQLSVVYQSQYGFSEGAAGLVYLCLFVGTMLGFVSMNMPHALFGPARIKEIALPERHMITTVISGTVISIGYFLFGWAVEAHVHWIVPIIGGGVVGFGWFLCTVSTRAYIVDIFGVYGVSAVAALLIVRNATAAVFPLVGPPLFMKLGYGWGCSVIGFLCLALLPLPIVLGIYGQRIREAGSLRILE